MKLDKKKIKNRYRKITIIHLIIFFIIAILGVGFLFIAERFNQKVMIITVFSLQWYPVLFSLSRCLNKRNFLLWISENNFETRFQTEEMARRAYDKFKKEEEERYYKKMVAKNEIRNSEDWDKLLKKLSLLK